MPARDEQQQIGEGEVGVGEARAERMALEMIDRDQRLVRGVRERLAGDQPDHHPADQPRPGGRGDRIDVGERYRSEEHTSELQSLMRSSYAVFCLNKKTII